MDEVNWDDLQPAQQSAQPASPDASGPNWDDLQPANAGPEPEGPIKSALREAAHGILPTLAGAATGLGGAALGTVVEPGVGTFAGGISGAVIGAGAAEKAQNALLKGMGYDD